jgi:hypothetical protein
MACWLEQPTSNNDFCDAIDEIMKHEHEDVILLGDNLSSGTALELDLDSISDLLEPSSTATKNSASTVSPSSSSSTTTTTDYTQPLNIYNMTPTSCATYPVNNNSQSNTATSTYSSLGISPQFTTLSINQHHHPFSPTSQDSNNSSTRLHPFGQSSLTINSKNNLHPPPYVQSQQQQDSSILGTSYPFELQINNGPLDVKRFRSASMNEGATQQQQTKLGKSFCLN